MRVSAHAKFLLAALLVVAKAIQVAVTDGQITSTETVEVVLAALGAFGIWVVPNAKTPPTA